MRYQGAKGNLDARHSSGMLKAVFPFIFVGGLLKVHAAERFNDHRIGNGVVNEQHTNRAEEL